MLRSLLAQVFARPKPPAPARGDEAIELARVREAIARKEWDAAADAVSRILAAHPGNIDATVLEAEVLRRRGRIEEAKKAYRRALVLDPRRADAWMDLGVCYDVSGDRFWARVYLQLACVLEPNNADIWNELGLIEIALGNFEKAEDSLENAVNRNPEHAEAWNNLGLVLARRGDRPNARRHFLRATFLKPAFYLAHCNLGLVCRELELLEEAERALRRAIEIDPAPVMARLNLGLVLQDRGRFEEAAALLGSASAQAPDDPDLLSAVSALWLKRGDPARALEYAVAALERDAGHAEARLALAHVQLAEGNFADGWINYEARLRSAASPARHFPFAAWRGEDPRGKSLFIYGEQGLGDEIMFASCLPDLVAAGARCIVDCDNRLRPLLRRSLPGIEVLESFNELEAAIASGARSVDFCAPIGSLPGFLRASRESFPQRQAYLVADKAAVERWRARLDALGAGIKVGLCWQGGLARTGGVLRSVPIERLLPLLGVEGVRWVNLQHKDCGAELERLRTSHALEVASWDEGLDDADEMAAMMCALDLVVTVCSSVVHLGGALGRPVWVLTPHAPPWRYLLEGTALPWYPSVRLFRQRVPSDWEDVVRTLASELRAYTRRES